MFPFSGILAGVGISPATYITSHSYSTTGANVAVSFSGAAAGHLAIIVTVAVNSNTLSGWTQQGPYSSGSYNSYIYSKTLTSADISAGSVTITGTPNGGAIFVLFYANANTATVVSTATGTGATLAVPGFNKSFRSRGIVTYCQQDVGTGSTLTPPGGTSQRVAPVGSIALETMAADILPPGAYANGSALTWTTFSTAHQIAQAIELT